VELSAKIRRFLSQSNHANQRSSARSSAYAPSVQSYELKDSKELLRGARRHPNPFKYISSPLAYAPKCVGKASGIFRVIHFQAGDDNNIIQYKEITFGRCSRPAALLGVMYFV